MHLSVPLVVFLFTASLNAKTPCNEQNNDLDGTINTDCDNPRQVETHCNVQLDGNIHITTYCSTPSDCCDVWKCIPPSQVPHGHAFRLLNGSILVLCDEGFTSARNVINCSKHGNWSHQIRCDSKVIQPNTNQSSTNDELNTRFGIPANSFVDKNHESRKLPRVAILIATIFGLLTIVATICLFVWVRHTRRANVCWSKQETDPIAEAHSDPSISGDNMLDVEQNLEPVTDEYEDIDIAVQEPEEMNQRNSTFYVTSPRPHSLEKQRSGSFKKRFTRKDSSLDVVEEEKHVE